MKKVLELVEKIDKHYVSCDCIQTMVKYKNDLTIFNKDGVVFSHSVGHILQLINI